MKRFIRYLYEYENEKRIRNVGFIKVETGCEETIVHLQAKGFHDSNERRLVLYLFFEENNRIVGIVQGEIELISPVMSWHYVFSAEDVGGVDNYNKICGVFIETENGRKIAATWDDRNVDVSKISVSVPREEVVPYKEAVSSDEAVPTDTGRENGEAGRSAQDRENYALRQEEQQQTEQCQEGQQQIRRTCTKISRQDIARLPHCEWKLANNQFLVHGYNNFHHLLLIDDGIYLKLGVPGIYHIKEAECADAFGFDEFYSADELGIISENNFQEEELFGYWCRLVRRRRNQ